MLRISKVKGAKGINLTKAIYLLAIHERIVA